MALTVIQEPQTLSFAGNPVIYRLQSNNYLEAAGVKFVGALNKSGTFAVGQKIIFQFGDNELVEMTAVTAPDDSGYQFKADSGAAITVTEFAAYFRSNYILNKYYEITTSGTNVIFTARETGSSYNWQSPSGVLSVTTAGVTAKERDNFRVKFDVFFRRNGAATYENIYSEEINADEPFTGIFSIDISRNLNAALEHDIPDFNSPVPFKCQKSKGEFYCQYAEVYGSPAKARKPTQGPVKHVTKGGLSHVGFKTKALLNILNPDAVDTSKDLFLKQGSRKLRVRTNQPEFLYFLNLRGHTSLKLKIKIEYATGLPHTAETAPVATIANDKVCFAAGYDLLNIGSFNPSRTVKQYQCWLVNQASAVVSETVTFVVDFERREVVRYFCATSSMGGVDTLPAFGKGSEEYEVTQSTAEKPLPLNYDLKDGRVSNYDLRIQRSFQVATGFLDKRRFDLLADFFLAEKKFLVKGITALPITVTNQKAGQYKDKQGLITQGIEYRYNHYDHQYTEGDAEEPGDYIEGFFFTSNLGGTFTGAETDPKVGAHIKAITPQQITGWDAMYTAWQTGSLGGGAASISWGNISGDILNQVDLKSALNGKAPISHNHSISNITGLQAALDSKLSASANDFINNQVALQPNATFHVKGGKFASYLITPKIAPVIGEMEQGEWYDWIGDEGFSGETPPTVDLSGYVPIGRTITINGVTHDLSSDRSWTVTTVDSYTKAESDARYASSTGYNKASWDAAAGWGDHAAAGYLIASANDFIKNQVALQPNATLHVKGGKFASYLITPKIAPVIGEMEQGEWYDWIGDEGFSGETPPTVDLSGYVPIGRTITINGVTHDLSSDRSWTVTTVDSYTKAESDGRYFPKSLTVDLNTYKSSGWLTVAGGHASNPFGGTGASGFASFESANWGWQMVGKNGGGLALRARAIGGTAGTFGSWYDLWHSGNFTPGTAATLDATTANTASKVVQRDSSGYGYFTAINCTGISAGSVVEFIVKNGADDYYREASVATVQSALGLSNYAPLSGATFTGAISATSGTFLRGTTTAFTATAFNSASQISILTGNATNSYAGIRFSGGASHEAFLGTVQNSSGYAELVWQSYSGSYGERFRINSSGGISAASATFKGASAYNGVFVDNTGATGGGYLAVRQNGITSGIFGVAGSIEGNAARNMGIFAESGLGINFYTGGSASIKAHITPDGRFGIGNGSPASLFEVNNGTTNVQATVTTPIGLNSYSQLVLGHGSTYFGASDVRWQIQSIGKGATVGNGADLKFQYWNGSTYTEFMRLSSNGNTGIGTTVPAHKFDVNLLHTQGVQFASPIAAGEWNHVTLGYTERNGAYEKIRLITQRLDNAARGDFHICVNTVVGSSSASLSDSRFKVSGISGYVHISSGLSIPGQAPVVSLMEVGKWYDWIE